MTYFQYACTELIEYLHKNNFTEGLGGTLGALWTHEPTGAQVAVVYGTTPEFERDWHATISRLSVILEKSVADVTSEIFNGEPTTKKVYLVAVEYVETYYAYELKIHEAYESEDDANKRAQEIEDTLDPRSRYTVQEVKVIEVNLIPKRVFNVTGR